MLGKQMRPRQTGSQVWIAAGALQIVVALLVYYWTSSHFRLSQQQALHAGGGLPSSANVVMSTKSQLFAEREALQQRLRTWNQQASVLGEADAQLMLKPLEQRALHADSSLGPVGGLAAHTGATPDAEDKGVARRQAAEEAVRGALNNIAALGGATGRQQAVSGSAAVSSAPLPTCTEPQDPRYPMKTAAQVAAEAPELANGLAKHAINGEIMFALVNAVMICQNKTLCWWDGGNVLESFLQILRHVNVTNYLIGALDDESALYLEKAGANYFRPNIAIPDSQKSTHPANRVSTIKYTLLQQIIQLGYNTLITDMDLVYIKNPFDHLHRDADVESQTDGFDDMAYGTMGGVSDKTMGWGGGGLYMQTFTTNVGCIYFKANPRTYKLVKRVADDLAAHPAWDQQVFNQHLMTVSHGDRDNPYATLRIMDYMKFMNSKIFFRTQRSRFIPGASSTAAAPVMVHFNYHPDKHKRMLCIMARYFDGKLDACDQFPGGSEPGT